MVTIQSTLAIGLALCTLAVRAHPGHDAAQEAANRAAYMSTLERRDLSHCQDVMWSSGLMARTIERRQALVNARRRSSGEHRASGLDKRNITEVLATDHHSAQHYTPDMPADVIFGSNRSCNLAPEIYEGPYYVEGELVRDNVVEDEPGVPLILDVLLIDRNTCNAIPKAMLEIWSCNSTGVYGGVVGVSNGNVEDASNINKTALRGVQATGEDGVATFETIFPGHYYGRANHVHVLSHHNATVLPNNTITGGTMSHVGEIYFDEALVEAVEALHPYNTNQLNRTVNKDDWFMAMGAVEDDPVVNYVMLGDELTDGLFAWITVGMDPTSHRTITPAVVYGAGGGTNYSGPPLTSRWRDEAAEEMKDE